MTPDSSIADELAWATGALSSSATPRLDAEVLLADCLGQNRTSLHAWPERAVHSAVQAQFRRRVTDRAKGIPIAYITGKREFWSLELHVDANVLVPRPETELLVEIALERIPRDANWSVLDLGSGSGAIALAIAKERPRCSIVATDISPGAIGVARSNAARLNITNVEFHCGEWFQPVTGRKFQLIASNPPYVAPNDPHLRRGDLPHEPQIALSCGEGGFGALRHIVAQAPRFLTTTGYLVLEHGYDQQTVLLELLESHGYSDRRGFQDYGGVARAVLGRRP